MISLVSARRRVRGVFYGWWIVASGFVVQLLNGALLFHSFTAYFVFLQAEFGWSRTVLAGAFSMTRVESGILGPIEGWLVDRFGPRTIMRIGVLLFGGGFIAFSQINSVLGYYAAFAVIALGSALAGFLPASAAVANWFLRRRATAMGIFMTGMGVGGLLVPAVTWSLAAHGWRTTAFAAGVVILVVGLPAVQLMRHHPEQYGYAPDGDTNGSERAALRGGTGPPNGTLPVLEGLTARQALRTRGFWYLSLGHSMALLAIASVMVHQMPHMVDSIGLSVHVAGAIVALLMGIAIIGQLAGGYIGDRVDKRVGMAACMWLHAVALVLFALAGSVLAVIAFAFLHGIAWGVRGPMLNSLRAEYFGRVAFATISGFSSLVTMGGMVIGPVFAGVMADAFGGDYRIAFLVIAVITAVGSVFYLLARPPAPPSRVEPAPVPAPVR